MTSGASTFRGSVRAYAAFLALAVLVILPSLPTVSAHSAGFTSTVTTTICVNAGFSGGALLFDDAGGSPTDRLWFVRVRIGLDSGDAIQYARFDFWLLDNAIAAEVATYRAPGYHWGAVGQYTYSDTLTAHIGGTFDLGVTITNSPDTANQCFIVLARAAWVIDG